MGSLFSFLSSPAGAVLGSVAMTLATWTYHKIKGDQTASLTDALRGAGKTVVDALVKAGALDTDTMTSMATDLMNTAMERLKIPHNAITDGIRDATVQHAVGDALAELRELDAAAMDAGNANLAKAVALAQKMPADMAAAAAAGRALVAPMASMIEVVPPDPATPPNPPTLDPAAASSTKAAQP